MRHPSPIKLRRFVALTGLLVFVATAYAAPPSHGLGQMWPNAQDVSANPQWHVYVFERDQIHYIQVNDSSGAVRAAFAVANGTALVLPIGGDADRASVLQQSPGTRISAAAGQIVYHDTQSQVAMVPQADGIGWVVTTTPQASYSISASDCTLQNCGGRIAPPVNSTSQAQ